jgi:hypothetical protein
MNTVCPTSRYGYSRDFMLRTRGESLHHVKQDVVIDAFGLVPNFPLQGLIVVPGRRSERLRFPR